jgi:CheY-like chemotaxis protein
LARAFAKAGVPKARLRMVADGEEAIEALKIVTPDPLIQESLRPSLIVLDVNLPKISGLDVLEWIRAFPALEGIPTFMLSSSEHSDHVNRAFELRTDSYYVKPRSRCAAGRRRRDARILAFPHVSPAS